MIDPVAVHVELASRPDSDALTLRLVGPTNVHRPNGDTVEVNVSLSVELSRKDVQEIRHLLTEWLSQ